MNISEANRCQWHGQAPHYEVWYLTFAIPEQGLGVWIRYTLTVPCTPSEGYSAVWFSLFDAHAPETSWGMRVASPIETVRQPSEGGIITKWGAFEGRTLRGHLRSPTHQVEWDFVLEEGFLPVYRPLPDWAYRSSFVPSRLTNVALSARVSGRLIVDGRAIQVSHAPGCQSHHWGRRLPKRWVWCHCSTFSSARLPLFEGLTLYLPLLPPLSLGGLWLPKEPKLLATGESLHIRSLREALRVQTFAQFPQWSIAFTRGLWRYQLKVSAPPKRFLRAVYDNPTGGQLYCHNTEIADAELIIEHKQGGAWQTEAHWQAPHSAFLEFGMPTPLPEVTKEIVRVHS